MEIQIQGERLTLLAQKAILWKKHDMLIVSDLHIGKATHFRKNAIPVHNETEKKNIQQMVQLFLAHPSSHVVFLGDLFHSRYNASWELLCDALKQFPHIKFTLVQGNHDFLDARHYQRAGISLVKELIVSPFILTHEPQASDQHYVISGHIHPGIKLKDGIRKAITLACFLFEENQAILPAFGNLTGKYVITPKVTDQVYVIVKDNIIKMNQPK